MPNCFVPYHRTERWRKWIIGVPIALIVGCLLWPLLSWQFTVRYRLSGDIAYMEYQPNVDWPPRRVEDPRRVEQFKNWLLTTHRALILRSAPPRPICRLTIHFSNGCEETMWISATQPTPPETPDDAMIEIGDFEMPIKYAESPRSKVRLRWRGWLRDGGSTDELNRILFSN